MGWTSSITPINDLKPTAQNALEAYKRTTGNLLTQMKVLNTHIRKEKNPSPTAPGEAAYTLYVHGVPEWEPFNSQYEAVFTVLLRVNWYGSEVARKEFSYEGGAPAVFLRSLPESVNFPPGDETGQRINTLLGKERTQAGNRRNLGRLITPGAKVRFASPMRLTDGQVVEWFDVIGSPSPAGRVMTSLAVAGVPVHAAQGWRSSVVEVIPAGRSVGLTADRSQDSLPAAA